MNAEAYKDLTRREFDRAASQFDNDDPSIYNMCRKDYPDILAEVRKESFHELLDAGCGTGAMVKLLAKDVPGKEYYGIDLSEKMIEVARENGETIHFRQGDCENLPYSDNSFDVVTCSMSFHHYPHVEDFFQSVSRVLKPGGRFILRDMTSNSVFVRWIVNHIELPLVNLAGKGDVHLYSLEEVRRLAEQVGLQMEISEARKGMRLHAVMRKPAIE
ncbi:MAG: class I SAM-dependent methyltransferase [Eubacteriales bacterium]|nr:class I SAM-dependent methyltransferase [Eubacteriales bacterium]